MIQRLIYIYICNWSEKKKLYSNCEVNLLAYIVSFCIHQNLLEGVLFITSLVFFVWCQVSTSLSGLIRKEWRKVLPVIRSAFHTQVPNQWRSRKDALLLKTLPSGKLCFDIGRISLLEIWNFFSVLLLTWQVYLWYIT